MSDESQAEGELIAKVAASSYVILGICLGMPAILSIMVILARPELFSEWLPMLALGIGALASAFLWLRTFHLQVCEGTLLYRTLFSGESRILLRDIIAVRRVLEFNPWTHWMKPRHRLEVYTAKNTGDTPQLYINLKVFRKRDIDDLYNLIERNKQVRPIPVRIPADAGP